MTGISATVGGESAVQAGIAAALEQLEGRSQVAMLVEGVALAGSAAQRAPMVTGELRRSIYVKPATKGVQVGFGAWYAAIVHERLDAHHKVGEAKFLERAKDALAHGLVRRLAAKIGVR